MSKRLENISVEVSEIESAIGTLDAAVARIDCAVARLRSFLDPVPDAKPERLVPRDMPAPPPAAKPGKHFPRKPPKPRAQAVFSSPSDQIRGQELLLRLLADGKRHDQASEILPEAAKLGVSADTLGVCRRLLGVQYARGGKGLNTRVWLWLGPNSHRTVQATRQVMSPEMAQRIRFFAKTHNHTEIAEKLGITKTAVERTLRGDR